MPPITIHECACTECACPAVVGDEDEMCDSCLIGLHGGPDIW
jgi:hypothetical protein